MTRGHDALPTGRPRSGGRPDNTHANAPARKPRGGSATMSHVDPDRDEVNFFPTPCWAARAVAELILMLDPGARSVGEPACGAGHYVHGLRDYFPAVYASDKFLYDGNLQHDFVGGKAYPFPRPDWVTTNPPFDLTEEFILHALGLATRGVALLMRGNLLEGQARHRLLTQTAPLTHFAAFSERVPMFRHRWDPVKSSAAFYGVFIWQKTRRGPPPPPQILWIPPGTKERLQRDSDRAFMALEDEA